MCILECVGQPRYLFLLEALCVCVCVCACVHSRVCGLTKVLISP